MLKSTSYRTLNGLGFILCVAALSFAIFYLERHLGFAPCPLCILDRVVIATIGILFFVAWLHNPAALGQRIYALLMLVLSSSGIALAWRHVYLQNLPPDRIPDCLPDLDYLLDTFPLMEVLSSILTSAGECAEISWTLMGLSIPQQTLLFFGLLFVLCLAIFVKPTSRRRYLFVPS